MRIGIMVGAGNEPEPGLNGLIALARRAEALGFDSLWMAQVYGFDAMTALALIGQQVPRLELGTAVVPIAPRHPVAMAQQALTVATACDGRFTLGLGLSHKLLIEDMFGLSYAAPARQMREYLAVLLPLLREGQVSHRGELYRVEFALKVPSAPPVPVLLAALGPAMLQLAGALADGTTTWATGARALENHIIPKLRQAAGAREPRVVAGLPIVLTRNPEAVGAVLQERLAIYGGLPSYRAMLDIEGVQSAAEVALLGDEAELQRGLQRLRDIGVTDFNAAMFEAEPGSFQRTLDFLAAEVGG